MDIRIQSLGLWTQSFVNNEVAVMPRPPEALKTAPLSTSAAMKRLNKVFLKKGQKVHKIRDKRAQHVLGKYCIKDAVTGDIISFSNRLTDWLEEEWLLGYEEFVADEDISRDGYQSCTGR